MNNPIRILIALSLIVLCLPARAGLLDQVTPVSEPFGVVAGDEFGVTGVAMSSDGLTFLAATPYIVLPAYFNDGTGSVYPMQYVNGSWSNPGGGFVNGPPTLTGYGTGLALSADGKTAFTGFGPDMSLTDDNFFVAYVRGLVYPNILEGMFTDPSGQVETNFGSTGAISGDGKTLLIGAYYTQVGAAQFAGEAYIYTFDAGTATWNLSASIPDPAATAGDCFGYGVALSEDGQRALISTGSCNESPGNPGTVYLYLNSSGTWVYDLTFPNVTGCQGCMALSADGTKIIYSGYDGSDVYVQTQTGSPQAYNGINIPGFNSPGPVAMSADGNAVVIGDDTNNGQAYLYTFSIPAGWTVANTFMNPQPSNFIGFGYNGVALSDDKETVAVSAGYAKIGGQFSAGAVYVYQSSADLSLAMTAIPTTVSLGQQVALNITVTNNDAQAAAYNVNLADTLPAGFTYISSSAAGGTCSATGQTVSCTLASLAPGAVWQPVISVKVSTAGSYSDTASVTSNQADPNTANNSASVSISMLPPTVSDGSVTTNENSPVSGTLSGSNSCNCGTPVFSVVALPSHGTVAITDTTTGAFTYTPTTGYTGSDSFTFKLGNGLDTSGTATESVTVSANVAPTAKNGSVSTGVASPVSGTLSATPAYVGESLTFAIVSNPAHGLLTLTNASTGAFTYTPAAGFNGSDSFTFTASGGGDTSNVATETVNVSGGGALGLPGLGLLGGLLVFVMRRRSRC